MEVELLAEVAAYWETEFEIVEGRSSYRLARRLSEAKSKSWIDESLEVLLMLEEMQYARDYSEKELQLWTRLNLSEQKRMHPSSSCGKPRDSRFEAGTQAEEQLSDQSLAAERSSDLVVEVGWREGLRVERHSG